MPSAHTAVERSYSFLQRDLEDLAPRFELARPSDAQRTPEAWRNDERFKPSSALGQSPKVGSVICVPSTMARGVAVCTPSQSSKAVPRVAVGRRSRFSEPGLGGGEVQQQQQQQQAPEGVGGKVGDAGADGAQGKEAGGGSGGKQRRSRVKARRARGSGGVARAAIKAAIQAARITRAGAFLAALKCSDPVGVASGSLSRALPAARWRQQQEPSMSLEPDEKLSVLARPCSAQHGSMSSISISTTAVHTSVSASGSTPTGAGPSTTAVK
ncbi:hypothetical protein FOA52_013268 [Chlamydomonas sp. UWO 241]|nr:hypothetical protein FOA52_013268 [Chlamydomonas sp. UWO 241]